MTNRSILFLGCIYSSDQIELYQNSSNRGYQHAAQNFQEAILDGLFQNGVQLSVATIPSLSTYPKACKLPIVKNCDYLYHGVKVGKSFGYINLPVLNHFYQKRIDKYIDKWYNNIQGEKCILVYAMLRNQMLYAVAAKKRHPDIKLCIVIPDLPLYMNCNKYYKLLGLQKRDMQVIDTLIHQFDSYVVLAEPMVDYLNIDDKPYIVVEGIYSEKGSREMPKTSSEIKTIMYAGGIQTRYGVFDLIEAFHRIEDDNYRLILCGGCQEKEKLQKYLDKDKRIQYLGMLPTGKVRDMQKEVSLLVNPRHSTEDFTKYSFPSKTLEYMASGTPVLMSPLPSMPQEYKDYLFLFDDESIDGMKKKIVEVCTMVPDYLSKIGDGAKRFILREKSAASQTKKMLNFLSWNQ